ncbi:MAG TPA: hypothetical protein VG326_11015 [Tepidisphaeraceae bacterium]|jgi:hypothetical protein|nr:hypothetical protein [Tepidisphaeraceae bacterium]
MTKLDRFLIPSPGDPGDGDAGQFHRGEYPSLKPAAGVPGEGGSGPAAIARAAPKAE